MKREMPLISVIVPVYNTKNYLERCLNSLICQTYRNLEIILIDDGSTDGSGELCDEWTEKDCRIQVYHKTNEGVSSARKKGVAVSMGEYIAQVDSDDWIEPEMYNQMIKLAVESDADVVTSGIIRDYENHSVIEHEGFKAGIYKGQRLKTEYWPNVIATDIFFKTNVNIHITNKLFKREIALKHQMKLSDKIQIGDDAATIYPVIFDAKCVAVTGKSFYHYVIRSNSMMNITENDKTSSDYIEKRFNSVINAKKNEIPGIEKQLDMVVLYNRLFNEPEQVFKMRGGTLYPFQNLKEGDRVIVYGAGRFGRRVFNYLHKTGCCTVSAWCDKTAGEMTVPMEDALQCNFDKVVIAVLLADVADEIEKMLISMKVEKERICRVGTE